MKIHHIGYLVDDIKAAALEFVNLGYSQTSEIVEDISREIYIQFFENDGYVVELIQPTSENSPIHKLRKKHRNSPYHICYETDDLQTEIASMVDNTNGRYVLLQPPQPAPAIGNRQVAFLVSKEIGMIEILGNINRD